MIDNFPDVFNIIWLFLKHKRFTRDEQSVLPIHLCANRFLAGALRTRESSILKKENWKHQMRTGGYPQKRQIPSSARLANPLLMSVLCSCFTSKMLLTWHWHATTWRYQKLYYLGYNYNHCFKWLHQVAPLNNSSTHMYIYNQIDRWPMTIE